MPENQNNIPKIIHYIWVGPKPLPDSAKHLIDGWQKIMPDYEYKFWNNDNVDFGIKYIKEAAETRAWQRVADYYRAAALAEHGGIYLDTDIEVRRRFDPLLPNHCFYGFQREDDFPHEIVNVSIIGAEKGHWFMKETTDYFDNNMNGRDEVNAGTGPGLVTKLLRRNGLKHYSSEPMLVKDITIYPREYFYPYHWEEKFTESCITSNTYAIHHWDHSWAPQTPPEKLRIKLKSGLYKLKSSIRKLVPTGS